MPNRPLIIAHRGASFDAPENTLAAFRLAFQQDADGIEGDFHLTADGHVVCFHDDTARRTANVDRRVAEMTLAELRALDVGRWKDERFAGERVATLAEVVAFLPPAKLLLIEVKCGVAIVPVLANALKPYRDRFANFRVMSFDANVVAAAKQAMPSLKTFWLTGWKRTGAGGITPTPADVVATLRTLNADGVDAAHELYALHPDLIPVVHAAGFEAHAWTVDDPGTARALVAAGVDSITTNRPDLIRERIGE